MIKYWTDLTASQQSVALGVKKPIHVVLVVHRFDAGGMERYVAALVNGVQSDSLRLSILCLDKSGTAQRWITQDNIPITELGLIGRSQLHSIRVFCDALEQIQPDIVHSHNWATLLTSYLAIRRYGAARHLHAERGSVLGSDPCNPFKRRLRAMLMRWICRRISLTTNSMRVAKTVESIVGIERSKIHVIPNGVECKYASEQLRDARIRIRKQLGISPHDYVLGNVARLSSVKNHGLAFDALHAVPAELLRQTHLLVVGDGPCRKELEQQVGRLGLSRCVHFVGHQWDTWQYLAAMDVFYNCSLSEGMSQAMLEAMAAGLPIIATDVGDAAEVLLSTEPCGIVVASRDCQAMTAAFIKMSTVNYREKLAKAAQACHRERYRLDTMLHRYENLYHQLAAQSQVA